ncbi:hypothetical protein CLI64_05395 [Nostoc sp. CENA543]|uniref:hypothetical protein n=1 Tax=Nostoc sp. CENA543 TaxID=1869241 RepID=UPI000CA2826A|nr:hypothetical protein [Nostoc sp. CENA543]AUS99868.1 hypothetical protein CLI64_05395 [Nostoc sp. CENA543]
MNIGIIESYSNGFIEVLPEGEGSDYWYIAAIHIDGEAYCPTPQLYRSEKVALKKAAKIYDWIADNETEINQETCYCSTLKLVIWRQPKAS